MPKKVAAKNGRPSKRTPEVVARVLELVGCGETLTYACELVGIAPRTWSDWTLADAELSAAFARARSLGFDALADKALRIAYTPQEGVVKKFGKDGVEETHEDMLGHRKLQIETILKLLAKWDPKRYGDRLTHEVGETTLAALLSEGSKKDDS